MPNDSVIIGKSRNRRRGTCDWCERHNQPLNYTVFVRNGEYHSAMICSRCLEDYEKQLRWEMHRQWMEEVGDE